MSQKESFLRAVTAKYGSVEQAAIHAEIESKIRSIKFVFNLLDEVRFALFGVSSWQY